MPEGQSYRYKPPTGVGLRETAADRRAGSRKIYLFKSLKQLSPKERLYAVGYNLTSLSYVMDIGGLGALISVPYMIGESLNNIKALRQGVRGNMSALVGRTRFLGGASFVNKNFGKAINAIRPKTGIGVIDRASGIAVGKAKAQFLHAARGKTGVDRIKMISEVNPFKFDSAIKAQAQIPHKGNVFMKWTTMTFMEAMKNAPHPFKDNPYYLARKSKQNSKTVSKNKFTHAVNKDSNMVVADNVTKFMSLADDSIDDIVRLQYVAHNDVVDYILGTSTDPRIAKIGGSNRSAADKRRQYYDSERRSVRGMFNREDNLIYDISASTPEQYLNKVAINKANAFPQLRRKGFDIDGERGTVTNAASRKQQEKTYEAFVMSASQDNFPSAQLAGLDQSILVQSLTGIELDSEMIDGFNSLATAFGIKPIMPNTPNMQSMLSEISHILNSVATNLDLKNFGGVMSQRIAALEVFAQLVSDKGNPSLAMNIMRQFSSSNYNFDEGGRLLIPDREDVRVGGAAGGNIPGLADQLEMFREGSYSTSSTKYKNIASNPQRGSSINLVSIPGIGMTEADLRAYFDELELARNLKKKIPTKKEFLSSVLQSPDSRANFLKQWFADGGEVFTEVAQVEMWDQIKGAPLGSGAGYGRSFGRVVKVPGGRYDLVTERGNRKQYWKKRNNKTFFLEGNRYVQDFIYNGVTPRQFMNIIEGEYNSLMSPELLKAARAKNRFLEAGDKAIAEALSMQEDFAKELASYSKYANQYFPEEHMGKSVATPSSHNYVPTQAHVRQAIHMEGPDFNGKNENDGTPYLFRYAVSFGGSTRMSKSADYIRDALAIEMGGPATDKNGKLAKRTDRMFYLPSYFMQIAATKSAAYLGVFDKGAMFSGTVKGKGAALKNATFKIDDESSIGAFNHLRRKSDSLSKELRQGNARVKKLFADLEKKIGTAERANYSKNAAHGVREAHERNLRRFKKAGAFGEVEISDVFRTVSKREAGSFGLAEGTQVFNENKLGSFTRKGTFLSAKLAKVTNDGYYSYRRKRSHFYSSFLQHSGTGDIQSGYSPVIHMRPEEYLDFKQNPMSIMGQTKITEIQEILSNKVAWAGLSGDISGVDRAAINMAFIKNAFNTKITPELNKFFANPYESMLETFDLHNASSGIWDPSNGIISNFNNPRNPFRKFSDLFMTGKFKRAYIKQLYEEAVSQAYPLLQAFPNDATEIMNKITRLIASYSGQYDRAIGQLLFSNSNAGWFSSEEGFRQVLIQLAGYLEGYKHKVRVQISQMARPLIKSMGPRADSQVARLATKYERLRQKSSSQASSVDALEELMADGKAVMYGNSDAELITIDINTGEASKLGEITQEQLRALYPSTKGRNPKNMTYADARRTYIAKMGGADTFEEVDFSRSFRFGNIGDNLSPDTKNYHPNYSPEDEIFREMQQQGFDPNDENQYRQFLILNIGEDAASYDNIDVLARLYYEGIGPKTNINNKKSFVEKIVAETKFNKANYNDFTPKRSEASLYNSAGLAKETRSYFKTISGPNNSGSNVGIEFISTFAQPIAKGTVSQGEAFAIIKETLNRIPKDQGKFFLEKIYLKWNTVYIGGARVSRSSDVRQQLESILNFSGMAPMHEVIMSNRGKRLEFFDEMAKQIRGIAGTSVNTFQDLIIFSANTTNVSRRRQKVNIRGFRRHNNRTPGVRSKIVETGHNKGEFTGVKDVTGPGFESVRMINYNAYKAYVKNKDRKAYVKKRWYGE